MCIKIKKGLWNVGAWLYSRGPFTILISLMIFLIILDKQKTLSNYEFFSVIFGTFTLWIGFLSFYLNKTKINLDLFDKRFEIYTACHQAVSIVVRDGTIDFHEAVKLLGSSNIHKARLLFGKEIVSYIDAIYKKCIQLDFTHKRLDTITNPNLTGEERSKVANENRDLLVEFGDELCRLPEVFEQYLSFKHIY